MSGAPLIPPTQQPAALRQRVKWLHLESVESLTRRLLAANGIDSQALRLARAPGLQEHRYRVDDHAVFIEGLAGRPAGHYELLERFAQPDSALVYPERFLCRLCAGGKRVEQIPHDRENWCLRHPGQMVWVGPSTAPEAQLIVPFDRAIAKAERRFRRMVAAGRVDARLHARTWEMVRDNAWLTRSNTWKSPLAEFSEDHEVRGRVALYPETVGIVALLSDRTNIERWRTWHGDELRDDIANVLPPMQGPVEVLVERIVLWLRPLRRKIRPTRINPLNVPVDIIDAAAIIDTSAPYPIWVQRHPRAVAEWDWSRNDPGRDPWDASGVSRKAWWVCNEGHAWETSPLVRGAAKSGCPCCKGQSVWPGHTDLRSLHPQLAAEWDGTPGVNAGDPDHVSPKSGRHVTWRCQVGHSWQASIASRLRGGHGCPFCSGRRAIPGETDLATVNPEVAAEWDYERNGGLSPHEFAAGSHKNMWWKCPRGHAWQTTVKQRSRGDGCPYCSGRRAISGQTDLATLRPDLAAEWDPDNELSPDQVAPFSNRRVDWRCNEDHTWRTTVAHRSKGRSCPICRGRRPPRRE